MFNQNSIMVRVIWKIFHRNKIRAYIVNVIMTDEIIALKITEHGKPVSQF